MKNCLNCGLKMANSIIFKGMQRNLQNRKFCVICSPFGEHNTRDIRNPKIPKSKGQYHQVKKFRLRRKQKCVELLGGKCIICGYSKCLGALQFHHKNPIEKDFSISEKVSWGFERLKKELKKCVLVCANCHAELHAGLTSLSNFKN